jgi:hypothetical protein
MNKRFIPVLTQPVQSNTLPPWYLAGGDAAPIQANRFLKKASLAAALVNEITPGTGDLTAGTNPPTWNTSTGARFITGDTDTQHLHTGMTALSGSVTSFVCFTVRTNGAADTVYGSYDSGTYYIQRNNVAGNLVFCSGGVITVTGGALTNGTHTLAMAGDTAYLDGQPVTGSLGGSAVNLEIFLGALNFGGTAVQGCGCDITHWAFWNTVISANQIASVHARAMAEATNP